MVLAASWWPPGRPRGRRTSRFELTVDAARLAADRHTIVVSGTYTCGPMELDVVAGGGTVDLTVRQGRVTGFGYVPILLCDDTVQTYRTEVTTFGTRQFTRARGQGQRLRDRPRRTATASAGRPSRTPSSDNQRLTISRRVSPPPPPNRRRRR